MSDPQNTSIRTRSTPGAEVEVCCCGTRYRLIGVVDPNGGVIVSWFDVPSSRTTRIYETTFDGNQPTGGWAAPICHSMRLGLGDAEGIELACRALIRILCPVADSEPTEADLVRRARQLIGQKP